MSITPLRLTGIVVGFGVVGVLIGLWFWWNHPSIMRYRLEYESFVLLGRGTKYFEEEYDELRSKNGVDDLPIVIHVDDVSMTFDEVGRESLEELGAVAGEYDAHGNQLWMIVAENMRISVWIKPNESIHSVTIFKNSSSKHYRYKEICISWEGQEQIALPLPGVEARAYFGKPVQKWRYRSLGP